MRRDEALRILHDHRAELQQRFAMISILIFCQGLPGERW
jgi:hypothetical protein